MTRYEATWSVSIDVDEPPGNDSTERLMVAMHLFVEEHRLWSKLRVDLNRGREEEWATHTVITPLRAHKAE